MASFPDTPMPIPQAAQMAVVQYYKSSISLYITSFNIRQQLLKRDRAYYREEDNTVANMRAKLANDVGDADKLQNITVPVVMPQTESALSNLAEVFLTGYPLFAAYASPGQEDAVQQMDAINADNGIKFGWVPNLMQAMRDGLKYDLGAVEVQWEQKKVFNIETPQEGKLQKGESRTTNYEGNVIRRLDPYNLLLDTRVSPDMNHIDGEFAGYCELLSRVATKKRMDELDKNDTMNFKAALESGSSQLYSSSADVEGFYVPEINPDALLPADRRADFDWLKWASIGNPSANKINYRNSYLWTVLYARVIPRDFGIRVPASDELQIWKFILVNGQTVIYAKRQTNAHNYLPIIVAKPSCDGLGWQSKSFAENVIPIQRASSSLLNSALSSQRRKVYDRILYDPTRVNKKDIDNVSPVARIPVRNSQLGKGLEAAVAPMPYRDDGVSDILQMSQQIVSMGEIINGQNRVQQGQFQKGNKTRREFDTVMFNANARQKMQALALEYSFFTPIKEIIKANILQFQPPASILMANAAQPTDIDPIKLRNAMVEFKMSDGMVSTEQLASLDVANTVLQAAAAVPEISMNYDIMGILDYTWKLQGLNWLDQFKRDEQQKAQLAQDTARQTAAGQPPKQAGSQAPVDAGASGAN